MIKKASEKIGPPVVVDTHLFRFGKETLNVHVLGKDLDWNLGGLPSVRKGLYNLEGSKEYVDAMAHIDLLSEMFGFKRLLVPRGVDNNARFAAFGHGTYDISLFSDQRNVCVLKNSLSADAFEIPSGFSCLVRSADCPTVIAWHPSGTVVGGHASRDSLLCTEEVLEKVVPKGRTYRTMVHAMMNPLNQFSAHEITVHISCGIAPEHFIHHPKDPKYGRYNKALARYFREKKWSDCLDNDGRLNLVEIITRQFEECGVPRKKMSLDTLCTFSGPGLW